MASTSERLKQIMAERNLRQTDIVELCRPHCKALGIRLEKNDLSQYVSGKVIPGSDKLKILELALGVNPAWIMGYDVPREVVTNLPIATNIIPMPLTHKVPLVGSIACGTPITAEQNIEAYIDIPSYVRADFCLTCKGDSMINARIFDGDIVCIRQQDTVDNGQIAAVLIGDEATLKRVQLYKDHISLEAENPMYKPQVYWEEAMNEVRILGLATHFISTIR